MKILFLSITSEIGGADLAMLRTIQALDKSEFQVIVAFPEDGPLVEAFRATGSEVVFIPMKRLRKTFNPFWHLSYLTGFRRTCRRLSALIRERRVDLVHANSLPNLYGGPAARISGVPCVWHVRELDLRPRVVRSFLARRALRQARHIVAVSKTVSQGVLTGPGGNCPDKVSVIYDSVDLRAFGPAKKRDSDIRMLSGLSADSPLAGIWCRFDEWKGLPVAIRAAGLLARDIPGFRLLIAGGPTAGHEDYAEYLKTLAAREAPEAVVFTGWLAPDDIPGFVAGLDVAIHASTSPEPFGLVIAEAMASGTPLVAPRIGSPLELVAHEQDGLLYDAGNPAALAVAVKRFLDDPELASACAKTGRGKAEELFDIGKNVRKLEDIYRALGEGAGK